MAAMRSLENIMSGSVWSFQNLSAWKLNEKTLLLCPQEIRAQVFVPSTEVRTHTGTRADSTRDTVPSSYCGKFGVA